MDPQDQGPRRILERSRSPIGLKDAIAFQRRPLRTLERRHQSRGELFGLTSVIAGRMFVIATPELAREVLHARPGTYLAGTANRRILPVLPENTVLTLDGDAHRERRRLLAPMFHGAALEAIAPVIRELTAREIERWPVGTPFAVLPRTRHLALSIVAGLILGIEDKASVRQLERHLRAALRPYSMLSGIEAAARLGPMSPQAAAARGRRGFARGLAEVVRWPPDRDADHASAMAAQLSADEVFALLLAGHETTATALAWTIELLSRSPDAADVLAREPSGSHRPWLEAVIEEALRLRPPLIDIVRQPAEAARLAGREIPAGTLLLIPPPLIHRHATSKDAERFEPERFVSRRPDQQEWLPFGGGDRRCLGASLAMLELREILPRIVERFVLAPARTVSERPMLYGTALVPARGARVVLDERQPTGSARRLRYFRPAEGERNAVEGAAAGAGKARWPEGRAVAARHRGGVLRRRSGT